MTNHSENPNFKNLTDLLKPCRLVILKSDPSIGRKPRKPKDTDILRLKELIEELEKEVKTND